jgi:F-type H+-transporting ATPase subunit epsilon
MNQESKDLTLYVVSPDGVIWNKKVDEVILPGTKGELGILPSHTSLITLVDIGTLKARVKNTWMQLLIFEGVAVINENDVILTIIGIENIEKLNYTLDEARQQLDNCSKKLKNISKELINPNNKDKDKDKDLKVQLEAIRELKLRNARVQVFKNQNYFNFK